MTITELITSMREAGIAPDQILDSVVKLEAKKPTRKKAPSKAANPVFEEVWKLWPSKARKRSPKGQSLQRFNDACKDYDAEDIKRAIVLYVRSPDAKKEDGQYAPTLERWLRNGMHINWLDDARPRDVREELKAIELGESAEHRFLKQCREDGASEWRIASWSKPGWFDIQRHDGQTYCVVDGRDDEFKVDFGKTLERFECKVYTRAFYDRLSRGRRA